METKLSGTVKFTWDSSFADGLGPRDAIEIKPKSNTEKRRIFAVNVVYLDIFLFVGVDTRTLTKKIREKGTMLGKVRSREITDIKGDYSISMAKGGYSLGRG